MISRSSSLREFQSLNRRIYLVTNDRNHSNTEIFSRLHRHITKVLKAVRKKDYDEIEWHLCMAFSWAFALANRLHINVADEMWQAYPGFCPYCLHAPCSCKQKRAKERQKTAGAFRGRRPVSMRDWQKMFAKIYPNVVGDSSSHLAEEAGEVDAAMCDFLATHDKELFGKIITELVDVITNIFGVANCLHIDLAAEMARYLANGCPKCRQFPCNCGFVAVDSPSQED